ncbi:MAG: NAD(P)/FAD-dependent oxidoreductase [Chloroflexi bacterium]|nr:NAD(P)/FAD-dependent oxidoreductase [Chloroflexota bacterium]
MQQRQIVVVGAGPAGLMAAGQAAMQGAPTLLIEKMERPARKLRITGKGRCNITNVAPLNSFIEHFGANGRFLRQAFARFFTQDLLHFLEEQGISTVTERGGRVFPASEQAQDVVDALVAWTQRCGVELMSGTPIGRIILDKGRAIGVQSVSGDTYAANAVVIATGGASYPATGSTGDGYRLAASVGHTIVPVRPALVPLETSGEVAQRLQGLSLRNVSAAVCIDGRETSRAFGEMLFTHFGVSGPIILSLSRQVVDGLQSGRRVEISIDLKPALDDAVLNARLLRDFDSHGKQQFHTVLKGLLPRKLIPICTDQTEIPRDKQAHQITAEERKRLHNWLKGFRLQVSGHRSFDEAIVTAGGVDVREVDPRTMESKRVMGLYFAGETLDVDADTGGYNLQAAFSTGWLAGRSAAERWLDVLDAADQTRGRA